MPYVEVSTIVAGSPAAIYPILRDMERYPQFMKDLVSVTVLERTENTAITSWVSNVDGRMIKWTERDVFDEGRFRISYMQVDGDLKKFEGAWQLASCLGGTKIQLSVDFEFGIPMVAGLLHPLLKRKVRENSLHMLAAIKRHVEEH